MRDFQVKATDCKRILRRFNQLSAQLYSFGLLLEKLYNFLPAGDSFYEALFVTSLVPFLYSRSRPRKINDATALRAAAVLYSSGHEYVSVQYFIDRACMKPITLGDAIAELRPQIALNVVLRRLSLG